MSSVEEIWDRAMELSQSERAALARDLLMSLEMEKLDEDSSAAWAAEIEARSVAVETGAFVASPWRESLERIRRFLAARRDR